VGDWKIFVGDRVNVEEEMRSGKKCLNKLTFDKFEALKEGENAPSAGFSKID